MAVPVPAAPSTPRPVPVRQTKAGPGRTTPGPSASHRGRPSPGARVSSRSRPRQGRPAGRPLRGRPLTRSLALKEQRRSRDGRRPVRPSAHPLAQGRTPGPCTLTAVNRRETSDLLPPRRSPPVQRFPGGRTHTLRTAVAGRNPPPTANLRPGQSRSLNRPGHTTPTPDTSMISTSVGTVAIGVTMI